MCGVAGGRQAWQAFFPPTFIMPCLPAVCHAHTTRWFCGAIFIEAKNPESRPAGMHYFPPHDNARRAAFGVFGRPFPPNRRQRSVATEPFRTLPDALAAGRVRMRRGGGAGGDYQPTEGKRFLPREARKRGLPVSEPRPIPPNTTGRRDAGGGSRVQNQSEIDPKYSIISYLLVYLYPEISKNIIKGCKK